MKRQGGRYNSDEQEADNEYIAMEAKYFLKFSCNVQFQTIWLKNYFITWFLWFVFFSLLTPFPGEKDNTLGKKA